MICMAWRETGRHHTTALNLFCRPTSNHQTSWHVNVAMLPSNKSPLATKGALYRQHTQAASTPSKWMHNGLWDTASISSDANVTWTACLVTMAKTKMSYVLRNWSFHSLSGNLYLLSHELQKQFVVLLATEIASLDTLQGTYPYYPYILNLGQKNMKIRRTSHCWEWISYILPGCKCWIICWPVH